MNGIVNFSWANALLSQPNENAEKERRNSAMPCIAMSEFFLAFISKKPEEGTPSSCYWLMLYARKKLHIDCSGGKRQTDSRWEMQSQPYV